MINLPTKLGRDRIQRLTGTALVGVSVLVLGLTFFPVLREEAKYQFLPSQDHKTVISRADERAQTIPSQVLLPVSEEFGIVIPKIGANARIIPDVDWEDGAVYQRALTEGVAHARGTAKPGEWGNVFLFSHSGVDFLEANRYNALFYLIDKLNPGDDIVVFFEGQKFEYRVVEKKKVAPEELEYLKGSEDQKTLTLMTCWPAGTTLQRLLVIAEQVE